MPTRPALSREAPRPASSTLGDAPPQRVVSAPAGHKGGVDLLLLADTHVPRRARDLPDELWSAIRAADAVLHAGDWVELSLLDRIEQEARAVVGCYGNNDGPPLRERLAEVAFAQLGGLRFGVVHETGAAVGREARVDAAHPGLDVLVFGHSHIPWDSVTPGGLRILNPGSPTDRRRQPTATYLTARAAGGRLEEVELHHLPQRPTRPRVRSGRAAAARSAESRTGSAAGSGRTGAAAGGGGSAAAPEPSAGTSAPRSGGTTSR